MAELVDGNEPGLDPHRGPERPHAVRIALLDPIALDLSAAHVLIGSRDGDREGIVHGEVPDAGNVLGRIPPERRRIAELPVLGKAADHRRGAVLHGGKRVRVALPRAEEHARHRLGLNAEHVSARALERPERVALGEREHNERPEGPKRGAGARVVLGNGRAGVSVPGLERAARLCQAAFPPAQVREEDLLGLGGRVLAAACHGVRRPKAGVSEPIGQAAAKGEVAPLSVEPIAILISKSLRPLDRRAAVALRRKTLDEKGYEVKRGPDVGVALERRRVFIPALARVHVLHRADIRRKALGVKGEPALLEAAVDHDAAKVPDAPGQLD